MECSEIEIFKHFLKPYTYIIWKDKSVIGFVTEDDIINLLDKQQLIELYHFDKKPYKVSNDKIAKYINKND
jgi:hypothetical protein